MILGCAIKWGIFPVVMDKMIDESLELAPDNTETWDAFVRRPLFYQLSKSTYIKLSISISEH